MDLKRSCLEGPAAVMHSTAEMLLNGTWTETTVMLF